MAAHSRIRRIAMTAPAVLPRRPRTEIANPYATGNFAPVDREQTLGELTVRGSLPPGLAGSLVRNGPNPAGSYAERQHWFTGDAMLHAVELRGGRALGYRNRYVRTARLEQQLGLPAAPVSPHQPFIQGTGNVNVIRHGGRILALGEAGLPYAMTAQLETLGQHDYAGALRSAMTAHPKLDPLTGELFFFGYDIGPVPLRYHVASPDGRLVRSLDLSLPRPVMMHDFAVTQTRAVFFDLPVVFDGQILRDGYSMPYRWDADHPARVGVMRRDGDGSDLRWITIPACYVYHVFNAYDDGERIVIDLVEHERTFMSSRVGPEDEVPPRAVRWILDPGRGTRTRRVLDTAGQEFPRVDPRSSCRPHRYGYAVEFTASPIGFGNLIKHDFQTGTRELHVVGAGRAASEGVFVPTGPAEDEGYVLAPVYDAAAGRSEIRVIDARQFRAPPVAVIELPVRIPFGFHGDFFPGEHS
jgi:carotenoid cleavage oxygenase